MPQSLQQVSESLRELIQPGYRGKLLARGLARSLIWSNGALPLEAPNFTSSLSTELLDHAFHLISLALRARNEGGAVSEWRHAMTLAGEAIESVVRRGDLRDPDRTFHVLVAACAFHLARLSARSYVLLDRWAETKDAASSLHQEIAAALMRRELDLFVSKSQQSSTSLDALELSVLYSISDDALDTQVIADAVVDGAYSSACGHLHAALRFGNQLNRKQASEAFEKIRGASRQRGDSATWWISTLTGAIADDLFECSLSKILSESELDNPAHSETWRMLRERYSFVLAARNLAEVDLWPSQIEAARRIGNEKDDLVVSLPTSAGKTRIAELAILRCLSGGRRAIYVTPLRSLSAQVERSLARIFVPLGSSVSALYGSAGVSRSDIMSLSSSRIVVSTPEKLDFGLRNDPSVLDDVGLVIFDESHMIGVPEQSNSTREIRYENLIQRILSREDAESRRLVCLSAVFATDHSFGDFTSWIRSDVPGEAIQEPWRPTRQRFGVLRPQVGGGWQLEYDVEGEKPWVRNFVSLRNPAKGTRRKQYPSDKQEFSIATAVALVDQGHSVLIYCPQAKSVEALAEVALKLSRQGFLHELPVSSEDYGEALAVARDWLGAEHIAVRALKAGIGIHHGSLPREYQQHVEALVASKKLKIVVASPSIAQGINLGCSALVFHSLHREQEPIPEREFSNVIGRVGRAYVDVEGVIVLPVFSVDDLYRVELFTSLRLQSKARKAESGVVQLVGQLISLLAELLNKQPQELLELFANATIWSATQESSESGESGHALAESLGEVDDVLDIRGEVLECLDEMDAAVLGLVPDVGIDSSVVATVIEKGLKASFWERRISRIDVAQRELQRAAMVSRAAWIWSNTSSAERKVAQASGIGVRTGTLLKSRDYEIGELLDKAELQLAFGEVPQAVAATIELAEILLEIPPFGSKKRHKEWREITRRWMSGEFIGDIEDDGSRKTMGFITNELMYRLVWAIESSRALREAARGGETQRQYGGISRALTYGVPDLKSALLLQLGVGSRSLARFISGLSNQAWTETGDALWWIGENLHAIQEAIDQSGSRDWPVLWRQYLNRSSSYDLTQWMERKDAFDVIWATGLQVPPEGTVVRVARGANANRHEVLDAGFRVLGTVNGGIHAVHGTHPIGVVERGGSEISIVSFAPLSKAL